MGLNLFGSSSSYDTCDTCKKSHVSIENPNPDPKNYTFSLLVTSSCPFSISA